MKSLLLELGDQEQTDLLNPNRITFKDAVLESLPKERFGIKFDNRIEPNI